MDVKRCGSCGETKPVELVHRRSKEGGYRSRCKLCLNSEQKQTSRKWKQDNKERVSAYNQDWREANRDKRIATEAERRARKVDAVLSPIDWSMLRTIVDCYLCGLPLEGPTCMDHIIPLTRGGAHCTANLLPTHRLCNERKYNLLLSELDWYHGPVDLGVSS